MDTAPKIPEVFSKTETKLLHGAAEERMRNKLPLPTTTKEPPPVASSAIVRLSLTCILAHWLACRIDWLERKGARFNNRFRGTFQHQANLGPLSRLKVWLGKHWAREYIEKRCNRW